MIVSSQDKGCLCVEKKGEWLEKIWRVFWFAISFLFLDSCSYKNVIMLS